MVVVCLNQGQKGLTMIPLESMIHFPPIITYSVDRCPSFPKANCFCYDSTWFWAWVCHFEHINNNTCEDSKLLSVTLRKTNDKALPLDGIYPRASPGLNSLLFFPSSIIPRLSRNTCMLLSAFLADFHCVRLLSNYICRFPAFIPITYTHDLFVG